LALGRQPELNGMITCAPILYISIAFIFFLILADEFERHEWWISLLWPILLIAVAVQFLRRIGANIG
jgi:NhaP-type Na+/H+ or K+/H+ antiporter